MATLIQTLQHVLESKDPLLANETKRILRITLEFPVLSALGLSSHPDESLHLKVEVSYHRQTALIAKTPVFFQGRSFVPAHFSIETMMAGKMLRHPYQIRLEAFCTRIIQAVRNPPNGIFRFRTIGLATLFAARLASQVTMNQAEQQLAVQTENRFHFVE